MESRTISLENTNTFPRGLIEAAAEYANSLGYNKQTDKVSIELAKIDFCKGALWLTKQGITVKGDTDDEYIRILEDVEKAIGEIAPDSNVIIQIRK